jgi:hypothetical protein
MKLDLHSLILFRAGFLTLEAAFPVPYTQGLLDSIQGVMSITATCRLPELLLCPLPTLPQQLETGGYYQHYTN